MCQIIILCFLTRVDSDYCFGENGRCHAVAEGVKDNPGVCYEEHCQ